MKLTLTSLLLALMFFTPSEQVWAKKNGFKHFWTASGGCVGARDSQSFPVEANYCKRRRPASLGESAVCCRVPKTNSGRNSRRSEPASEVFDPFKNGAIR